MPEGIALLTIFVLSAFTGYEVISKVSTILHTPLMSSANAISGLILVGAILVTGRADSTVELVVGLTAVALASVNLVGGFVVTDRMLDMFRGRRQPVAAGAAAGAAVGSVAGAAGAGSTESPAVQAETSDADGDDPDGHSSSGSDDSDGYGTGGYDTDGRDLDKLPDNNDDPYDFDDPGQSGAERHG